MNKSTVITSFDSLIPLIQESFSKGQDISFTVKGTSMNPFFVSNETEVTVSPFKGSLNKGNVYLYKVEDKYLLHRYIKTKNQLHYFRGDALYNFELVDQEKIIGVVKEMKYKGQIIHCTNFFYRNNVRYYLFKKSIKLFLRRIIKGR